MIWLLLGLLLWSGSHLFKRLAPQQRAAMGEAGKGPVALASLAGIVLMVIGYRVWDDSAMLWPRASWQVHVNNLGMLIAVYLFAASGMKTWVAGHYRHPQLMGVLVWSVSHLLVNGDLASLVLFGGLAAWSVASMTLINRAEPTWVRPGPAPAGKEIGALVGAFVVVGLVGWIHMWFGLSPFR